MFSRVGSLLALPSLMTARTLTNQAASRVELTVQNKIATITVGTLDHNLNTVGVSTLRDLRNALQKLTSERWCVQHHDIRRPSFNAVVFNLTGAGADIRDFKDVTKQEITKLVELAIGVSKQIQGLHVPTIARTNGIAYGLILELMLACDLRCASNESLFALLEIKLGLLPGCLGTRLLTDLIGKSRALQLMYTGRPCDAARALDYGLINEMYPVDKMDALFQAFVTEIASHSPEALKAIKYATNKGLESPEAGDRWATELFGDLVTSPAASRKINRFIDKDSGQ